MNTDGVLEFSVPVHTLTISMIVVLAVILSCILFGMYIDKSPIVLVELASYSLFSFLITQTPRWFHSDVTHVWGTMFALCLTMTLSSTYLRSDIKNPILFHVVNTLIHKIVGIYLKSTFVCAVSILLVSFSVILGFDRVILSLFKYDAVLIIVLMSGTIALINYLIDINGIFLKKPEFFVPGLSWLGPIALLSSLLLISSSVYNEGGQFKIPSQDGHKTSYIVNNLITIVLSGGAILFGKLFDIAELSGIGGTYICIFIFVKFVEIIPKDGKTFALVSLLGGLVCAMYVRSD